MEFSRKKALLSLGIGTLVGLFVAQNQDASWYDAFSDVLSILLIVGLYGLGLQILSPESKSEKPKE